MVKTLINGKDNMQKVNAFISDLLSKLRKSISLSLTIHRRNMSTKAKVYRGFFHKLSKCFFADIRKLK